MKKLESLIKEEVKKVLENLSNELEEQKLKPWYDDPLKVYSPLDPLKPYGAFGNGLPNAKYNGHGVASCGCIVCRRYFASGRRDKDGNPITFGEYLDSVRDYYFSLKDQFPELSSK